MKSRVAFVVGLALCALAIRPALGQPADALKKAQSAFDQATTSAVRANTSIAGTIQEGAQQFTIDGQQELTLSGVGDATRLQHGIEPGRIR